MNVQSKLEAEKQALIESLNSVEKRLNEEKRNRSVTSNYLIDFDFNKFIFQTRATN